MKNRREKDRSRNGLDERQFLPYLGGIKARSKASIVFSTVAMKSNAE